MVASRRRSGSRANARRAVFEGYVRQAGVPAGPSDVDVDFNWPDENLFRVVDVPAGCPPGDTVIAGDGEGNGERLVVVERDGALGLVADPSTFTNPTDELWRDAWDEAEALLSDPTRSARLVAYLSMCSFIASVDRRQPSVGRRSACHSTPSGVARGP